MALCVVCSSEIRDDARFCPSCGAEQPRTEVAGTDADPLMGKVVAKKFKIEKLLGVGGMGKVYKARQLSLDKAVVVKVLHDHFREDPQLVQRFQREAKAASRLNHPNSIQIIDFGQDDTGVVFMAMEFLQGQDLYSLLKREGALPADRVVRIMLQVCSALAEAHEQNVIHRDLKPENIMVEDRRGQRDYVKVLDFGIAKIQDPQEGQQQLTQAGMVCGTPEYMSPEQARGLNLDLRSDIYALGVVMYQLAVGELPFQSDTPIGIVTKHILEKPVPPRERAPQLNIPEALEAIILRALEKEPEKRFASAGALGEALEALQLQAMQAPVTSPSSAQVRPATSTSAPSGAPVASNAAAKPTGTSDLAADRVTEDSAISPRPKAPPLRMAAIVFGVVAVVGIGIAVGAKLLLRPSEPVAVAVVDASVAKVDAAPVAPVAPVVAAAPDAGVPVVDAGTVATNPEPTPDVKPDVDPPADEPDTAKPATNKPEPKNKPGFSRAKAVALHKKAVGLYNTGDGTTCTDAMRKAFDVAANADPSYAEPYKYISSCYMQSKNKKLACMAIRRYVELKGKDISDKQASQLVDMRCKE